MLYKLGISVVNTTRANHLQGHFIIEILDFNNSKIL
jgi:hypothetical protein